MTFGVSGKLIRNGLVMYDDETETLWSQILGEAVRGLFAGSKLELVPSVQTTWKVWREMHPDTLALDKRGGYRSDPYLRYYRSDDRGILGANIDDRRLYPKEYVIGVAIDGSSKAYPFSVLESLRVVNDKIGPRPVVIVFDADSTTGRVFERSIAGRELTFSVVSEGGKGQFILQDDQTGTRWTALTGEAVEGGLAGHTLTPLPSTYSFWFGWVDYHPETELFTG